MDTNKHVTIFGNYCKKGCLLMTVALVVLLYMGQAATNTTPSADFDGDGVVGIFDFLLFVQKFGSSQGDETYEAKYDLDGDGKIGISDFLIFVENFGKAVSSSDSGNPAIPTSK
ncbi:MAG: dockerin type I domain-containing protein, partial [Candidatus Poribacteria bacterium]|nr:dockerin type I domain-containing protein [Candidatus Poribacteria bacterium]